MNITVNELLLMDKKIKFGAKDSDTATTNVPAPETTNSQAGMKALTFQGMKNLMEDPQLASEVGLNEGNVPNTKTSANEYVIPYSSNIAFQGTPGKFKTLGMAAVMTLATMFSSCSDKPDITVVDREPSSVSVVVNNTTSEETRTFISMMVNLLQEMLEEQKKGNQNSSYSNELILSVISYLQSIDAKTGNIENILTNLFNKACNIENNQKQSLLYQETLATLLHNAGMDINEAKALVAQAVFEVKSGKTASAEALAEIMAKLDLANKTLANIYGAVVDGFNQAHQDEEDLKELAQYANAQRELLVNNSNKKLEDDKIMIAQYENLIEIAKKTNEDNNRNAMLAFQQMGISHTQLMNMLAFTHWTTNELLAKSFGEVIGAINDFIGYTKNRDERLEKLLQEKGITDAEFKAKLLDLLNQMASDISTIKNTVVQLYEKYLEDSRKNDMYHATMIAGQGINNQLLTYIWKNGERTNKLLWENNQTLKEMKDNLNKTNEKLDSLITLGNEKPDELKQVVLDAVAKGEKLFIMAGIKKDMIAQQIIAALKDLKYTYFATEQQKIALEMYQNQLLATYLPLLKNKTGDNADVIEALRILGDKIDQVGDKVENGNVQNNADNAEIIALLEDANAKLEALKAKADTIIGKMDASITAFNTFAAKFDNVSAKLDDLKDLVKTGNADRAYIKTQLAALLADQKAAAAQRNQILAAIKALRDEIAELEAIGGGLTKAELEQVLGDKYALLEALLLKIHAEDIAEAQDQTELLIKNNELLGKILDAILALNPSSPDYNARFDELVDLLKKLQLCACSNNEGIIYDVIGGQH